MLSGVIAALLARGLEPADAAMAGAFVHGVAGDLAGARLGEGATAVDVQAPPAGRDPAIRGGGRADGPR